MAPSWSSRSTAPVAIRPRPAPSERTSTAAGHQPSRPLLRGLGGARGLHPVAELVPRDAVVAAEVVAEPDVVVVHDLDLPGVEVWRRARAAASRCNPRRATRSTPRRRSRRRRTASRCRRRRRRPRGRGSACGRPPGLPRPRPRCSRSSRGRAGRCAGRRCRTRNRRPESRGPSAACGWSCRCRLRTRCPPRRRCRAGSASASAGRISQRAPPLKAATTSATPITITMIAIEDSVSGRCCPGRSDAHDREADQAGDRDDDQQQHPPERSRRAGRLRAVRLLGRARRSSSRGR